MTKRDRERIRRHAAVLAIATREPEADSDSDHWNALLHWRGDDEAPPIRLDRSQS